MQDNDKTKDQLINELIELRQKVKSSALFFENAPVYCYKILPNGTILDVNNTALKALGYTKEELIGKPVKNIYAPESLPHVSKLFEIWKTTGELCDEKVTILTKNGNKRIVLLNVTAIKDKSDNIIHSISIQKDISLQNKVENELQKIENINSTIISNANDLIFFTDKDGNVIFYNDAVSKQYEIHSQEIINCPICFYWCGESIALVEAMVNYVKKNKKATSIECECENSFYELNIIPVINNNSITSMVGIARDITMRKNAQELAVSVAAAESEKKRANELDIAYKQLKLEILEREKTEDELKKAKEQAEIANKAKSEFLANMSHEIRTPMNSILGFTDILLEEESVQEKRKQLEIINKNGSHLLDIINDILDLSKIEEGKLKLFNSNFSLKILFSEIKKIFSSTFSNRMKYLQFNINIPKDLPTFFFGDEKLIKQVLLNIIGNAFKFTNTGSIIVDCSYHAENETVQILVKDTGIGISNKSQKNIFLPFEQATPNTEYKRTGLGLTITKKIIDLMKGSLSLKSQKGTGSLFTITFPLKQVNDLALNNNLNSVFQKEAQNITFPKGKKILIVEDNLDNQFIIKAFLANLNLDINLADNGKIALEMLGNKSYDLVLLDLNMPVMNGMETLQNIRKSNSLKKLKVVALTAYSLVGDREKFLRAGCDDYLSKPIDKDDLIFALAKFLK